MKQRLTSVLLLAGAALALTACTRFSGPEAPVKPYAFSEPAHAAGQKDAIRLACPPITGKVRVAFIGVGNRGGDAVRRFTYLEDATVTAVCDIDAGYVQRAVKTLTGKGRPAPAVYTGRDDWKKVCERDDVDLVYICTPWELHAKIALYAMEKGKHAAVEVPAALSVEDCWKLVDTAERTRRHCMMLENCNYDFFEMACLNMAQQGVFGDIRHAEGAYIHDLRDLHFSSTFYKEMWRLEECKVRTGCLYPTHGIGPIAHVLNIHRGDRMDTLVSVSTNQTGMTAYAKERFGEDSAQARTPYRLGDMNSTIIRTVNGKTMLIQHDVTSPRPYDRLYKISGTKGFCQKYPNTGLAFDKPYGPGAHSWLSPAARDAMLKKYEHPIVREIAETAKKVGGHGGMDFIMDYRLIYCLKNGLPLDQDVYDGAEWSVIVPLSQKSVEMGGCPVAIPDFTRGAWKTAGPVKYHTAGESRGQ